MQTEGKKQTADQLQTGEMQNRLYQLIQPNMHEKAKIKTG